MTIGANETAVSYNSTFPKLHSAHGKRTHKNMHVVDYKYTIQPWAGVVKDH